MDREAFFMRRAAIRGGYIPPEFRADTLAKLEERCGPYAVAAMADARWGAATVWWMHGETGMAEEPVPSAVGLALRLRRTAERARLGFPTVADQPQPMDLLTALSPASRAVANELANSVIEAWELAGCPHLSASCIRTHKRIDVCMGELERLAS